jgi:hypothetical protein
MKKYVIGCVAAAVIVVAIVAVAICLLEITRDLPLLDASLSLPSEVQLDSTLTMVVTTTNTHSEPVILDSIDMDDSFLAGLQVLSIDPEPTDTLHIPVINQRSWAFGKRVLPGSSLPVTFELRAVMEGHFSGDIDVCNPNQDFTTLVADLVVSKDLAGDPLDWLPDPGPDAPLEDH